MEGKNLPIFANPDFQLDSFRDTYFEDAMEVSTLRRHRYEQLDCHAIFCLV
jgi:hypothetical protein